MEAIKQTFAKCKEQKRSALVTYVTAGYPTNDETVDILLGLENGGAGTQFVFPAMPCVATVPFRSQLTKLLMLDVIELGLPFTDPIADGPTIQKANTQALANGVTIPMVLDMVRTARRKGLQAPVLFMGYYNPVLQYGEERMLKDTKAAGANGFIMVDLPPEEAVRFRNLCTSNG